MAALAISVVVGVLIRFKTKTSRPPLRASIPLMLFAFFMSITWISVAADILIDLLTLQGVILQIDPALLGMSILAWGNSLGDLMACISIAKKGLAEMAITGCYAGTLFNVLLGLGLIALKTDLNPKVASVDFSIRD